MKKLLLYAGLLFGSLSAFAQQLPQTYVELIKKADAFYKAKDYKESAFAYSEAFKANGWKGTQDDRYNAACSWAMAGYPDSAFFNLNRLALLFGYTSYDQITVDADLQPLHADKRWQPLLEQIKKNKDKAEASFNKPLIARLDSIYTEDQQYRQQMSGLAKQYGWDSKEMKALWKVTNRSDSISLLKVTAILDRYGWLGPEVVSEQGNNTLFLVIQHSNQATQEKYLPMMREAVKNKKASASGLALLEDRVLLGQGKKQIYGSQVVQDPKTKKAYVLPLQDPDHVDQRRAEVGLPPLSQYLEHWALTWNVEQYKKDLAASEAEKQNKK